VQIYRENRNRRWEREDRERTAAELAKKVKDEATAIQEERQRIARELADKVTQEAAAVAAKVAAEANFARARGYHIQEAIAAVGVKADANQDAIAQVGAKADAAFDVGNHTNEKFDKVHERLTDLNTQLVKQGEEAAAAAATDKPPLKVEVVNTPLLTMVERHK
jgi:hypothetical protein